MGWFLVGRGHYNLPICLYKKLHQQPLLVGGWINPFEKYWSKWESSPNRGENKNYLKPPPRLAVNLYTILKIITLRSNSLGKWKMLQGVAGLQHWHVQNDGTCNKTSHLYCPLEEFLRVVWVIFLIPSLWNIHKPGLVNNRKKVATLSTCSCLSRGFPSLQKSLKCNVSAGKIFNLERIEPVRFLCIVIPVCDLVMNSLLGFSWCSGFNLYQPDPQKTSRIHSSWPLWTTNTSLRRFPQVTQVSRPKFKKQLEKQKLLNHHHSFFINDHLSVDSRFSSKLKSPIKIQLYIVYIYIYYGFFQ